MMANTVTPPATVSLRKLNRPADASTGRPIAKSWKRLSNHWQYGTL